MLSTRQGNEPGKGIFLSRKKNKFLISFFIKDMDVERSELLRKTRKF